jgi:hypothetical protein
MYRLMEICGGHTHAIIQFGPQRLLPENFAFVHALVQRGKRFRQSLISDCAREYFTTYFHL